MRIEKALDRIFPLAVRMFTHIGESQAIGRTAPEKRRAVIRKVEEAAEEIRRIVEEPEPEPEPLSEKPMEFVPFGEGECDHRSDFSGNGSPVRWIPFQKKWRCILCGAEFVPVLKEAGE